MTPEELDALYDKDPESWADVLGLVHVGWEVSMYIREGHYTKVLSKDPFGPCKSVARPMFIKKEL